MLHDTDEEEDALSAYDPYEAFVRGDAGRDDRDLDGAPIGTEEALEPWADGLAGEQVLMEGSDVDEQNGFQYTALPTDQAMASVETPIVTCFYRQPCAACDRFRAEWNSLVQEAMDEVPTVLFAVVDVGARPEGGTRRPGAPAVPHVRLHLGQADPHVTGAAPADELWSWLQRHVAEASRV